MSKPVRFGTIISTLDAKGENRRITLESPERKWYSFPERIA
jgi:hypothetical protein